MLIKILIMYVYDIAVSVHVHVCFLCFLLLIYVTSVYPFLTGLVALSAEKKKGVGT